VATRGGKVIPINGTAASAYPVGAPPAASAAASSAATILVGTATVTTTTASTSTNQITSVSTTTITTAVTAREIVVNSEAPTTSIAVRLHNGQQIKVTVNMSHTVQDLIDHVAWFVYHEKSLL